MGQVPYKFITSTYNTYQDNYLLYLEYLHFKFIPNSDHNTYILNKHALVKLKSTQSNTKTHHVVVRSQQQRPAGIQFDYAPK